METIVLVLLILGAILFALALPDRLYNAWHGWVPAGLLCWLAAVILERLA